MSAPHGHLEPLLAEPVRRRTTPPATEYVGEVRLPLADGCHPRARLYLLPDARLLWVVRLWEVDHVVAHAVATATIRAFARANRLPSVLAEIDALVAAAREAARARA
jgi:hypothetical protein